MVIEKNVNDAADQPHALQALPSADAMRVPVWYRNESLMYGILCSGIVFSLLFWPLLNSLFCFALLAYWLFFSRKTFHAGSFRSRMVMLFGMMYLLVIIGTFYSVNTDEALFKVQQKIPLLLFPLVFGTTSVITAKVFRTTFSVFVLSTVAGCLVCMGFGVWVYITTGSTAQLAGYPMVILKDMHPVVLGLCALLSLIYILDLFSRARRSSGHVPWAAAYVLAATILIVHLFLVGNRSNLISLALIGLFYAITMLRSTLARFAFLAILAAVFVGAVIINPALNRQWNDMIDFSAERSIQLDRQQTAGQEFGGKTIRLAIWQCAGDVLKTHWLAGVGTGDVWQALQQSFRERSFNAGEGHREYNAHNQWLQEMLAYGIFGALIFSSCLLLPLLLSLQNRETVYTLFLLCFCFVCLTESLLELNKGLVWYAFFNALCFFKAFRGEDLGKESLLKSRT